MTNVNAKEGFPRLLQRIQSALGEQNKFKNKVNEYNESVDQVRRNLEQIIKPADTIKSKLPSYADKATESNTKQDVILGKADEVKLLIEELVKQAKLNNLDDVREFINELKDEGTLSKPQEIKEVLDEILKQGKIDAEEEKQLRIEILEHFKTKQAPPPQYWVQQLKDSFDRNDFKPFVNIDNDYGIC